MERRLRVDVAGGVGSAQAADRAQGRDDCRAWRWRDDRNGGDAVGEDVVAEA